MSKYLSKCCGGSFKRPRFIIRVGSYQKGKCPNCERLVGMLRADKLAGHYPEDPS